MVRGWTILVFTVLASSAYAGDVIVPSAVKPSGTTVVVAAGAGNQVSPSVSGTIVAYTAQPEGRIHYVNLTDNSDNAIPRADYTGDLLPDVSGNTIVFVHAYDLYSRVICAYDVTSKTTTVLDPPSDPQAQPDRMYPRVGGRTVVWEERFPTSLYSEIVVFDLDSGISTRLTNDGGYDRWPAVSPDGSTVVWTKLVSASENQLWQATRNTDGTWTTKQLTTGGFPYTQPVTNGEIVVYSMQNPADPYQSEILLQPIGGGIETRLVIPGIQYSYRIFGHLIVFIGSPSASYSDVYAYDIDSNTLYQITDTPDSSERLDDVFVDADGTARVVWNRGASDDLDVLEFTFHLGQQYTVQPLFDQGRSYKAGSVVPIKLQLLDAQGNNVSAADLVVSTTNVIPVGGDTPSDVADAGNANPDSNFRYDATLEGYVFNLSTKNLAPGTWELHFVAGTDSSPYSIRFSLR